MGFFVYSPYIPANEDITIYYRRVFLWFPHLVSGRFRWLIGAVEQRRMIENWFGFGEHCSLDEHLGYHTEEEVFVEQI